MEQQRNPILPISVGFHILISAAHTLTNIYSLPDIIILEALRGLF